MKSNWVGIGKLVPWTDSGALGMHSLKGPDAGLAWETTRRPIAIPRAFELQITTGPLVRALEWIRFRARLSGIWHCRSTIPVQKCGAECGSGRAGARI